MELPTMFGRKKPSKTALQSLLSDFPWLWAIRHSYVSYNESVIKVNQDMNDLKIVLCQKPCDSPNFELWAFSGYTDGGGHITKLEGQQKATWAEVIMLYFQRTTHIDYVVAVNRSILFLNQIIIFRRPEKGPLNEVVEQVCRLSGSSAHWHIPEPDLC